MLHDPDAFEKPLEFNPARYRGSDFEMRKVTDLVFGFGHRACPGTHLAHNTLAAIILTVLATCDILPPSDQNDISVFSKVAFSSGTIV